MRGGIQWVTHESRNTILGLLDVLTERAKPSAM